MKKVFHLFVALSLCLSLLIVPVGATGGMWYEADLAAASELGLAAYDAPNQAVTRGEFLYGLWQLDGVPMITYNQDSFAEFYLQGLDPIEKEVQDAFIWAAFHDLVFGYPDYTMCTGNVITRQEMAVFAYRYAMLHNHADVAASYQASEYEDLGTVCDYALHSMNWCVYMGILNGIDGKLLPQAPVTQAQAATVLMRLHNAVK